MWKKILIIVFALIVVFSLSGVFNAFAFLGPPGNPPFNNNILQVTSSRAFVIATTTVISMQPQLIFRNVGNPGDIILFPSPANGGKVGIGTTAPDEKLHVSGNLKITGDSTITGTLSATNLVASGTLAGTLSAGYLSAGVFGLSSTKGNYTFQGSGSTNPILFIDAANERVAIGTSTASSLFSVATTSAIFNVLNTGRVGIGTTNPSASLDIVSGSNVTPLEIKSTGITGSGVVFRAKNGNDTEIFTILGNGAVGIGTTTPSASLHVWSNSLGATVGNFDSTSTVSYIQIHNSATGYNGTSDGLTVGMNSTGAYFYNREAGDLHLGTNSSSRLTINSTGDIGIGTTAPSGKLHVFDNTTLPISDLFIVKSGPLVGIGTSTPAAPLTVYKEQNRTSYTGTAKGLVHLVGGTNYGDLTTITFSQSTGGNPLAIIGSAYTQTGTNLFFGNSESYGSGITGINMVVAPGGVSINLGTSSPQYNLDVGGAGRFTQPVIVGTPTQDTHAATKSYVDSAFTGGAATGTLASLQVTGTTTLATVSGSVGVGTISPVAKLNIQDSSAQLFQFKRTGIFDSVQSYLTAISGSGVAGWNNWTDEAGSTKGTAQGDILGVTGDSFYMGKSSKFDSVYVDVATAKTSGGTFAYEYSTGEGTWSAITDIVDNTAAFTNDGLMTFTSPGDWQPATVNGVASLYWIRVRVTGSSFSTEPTIYLAVPNDGTRPMELFANNNDTTASLHMDQQGNIGIGYADDPAYRLKVAGAGYFSGTLAAGSTLSGGAISGSGLISSYNSDRTFIGGLAESQRLYLYQHDSYSALATATVQYSPSISLSGEAWNGSASMKSAMQILVIPSSKATVDHRLAFKNSYVNNVADNSEVMSISSDGVLEVVGTTLGSEVLADNVFDTVPPTNWSVSGDWAHTVGDYTFTFVSGSGTLTQDSAKFLTTAKPNTWYRFSFTNGVAGPAGTVAWIGTEFAEENTYFTTSATEVNVYFKTNSNPGDFVIYTTATVTSGFRMDDVSLKEVQGGDIHANGSFGGGGVASLKIDKSGNIGIATTTPSYTLDVVGTAQFSQPIIVGTPTIGSHATTKSYVDSVLTAGTATGTLANLIVTGTTTLATINGRVGIGTEAPGEKLDVFGGSIIVRETDELNKNAVLIGAGTLSGYINLYNGGNITTQLPGYAGQSTYFNNGGNLGIGTTTPNYALTLGSGQISGPAGSISTPTYTNFNDPDTGMWFNGTGNIAFSVNGAQMLGMTGSIFQLANGLPLQWGGSDVNITGTNNSGTSTDVMAFQVGGAETMRIARNTTGFNIGIGTTTPAKLLTLSSGAPEILLVDSDGGDNYSHYVNGGSNVLSYNNSDSRYDLVVDGSGNVGIGTTTPGAKLTVAGTVRIDASGDGRLTFFNGGTYKGELKYDSSNDSIKIFTAGTSVIPKLTILDSGYVGIATTTPSYGLDVVGTAQFSQPIIVGTPTIAGHATTKSYVDSVLTGGTATGTLANLTVTGTTTLATTAGNVGIGTTNPGKLLEVNGEGRFANHLTLDDNSGDSPSLFFIEGGNTEFEIKLADEGYAWLQTSNTADHILLQPSGGNVGIGTTTPASKFVVAGSKVNFQVLDTGSLSLLGTDETAGAATDFIIRTGANNTNSPNIILQKGRSNAGMAIGSGDNMGSIKFYGGTGSAFAEGARIRGDAEGTFTTSSLPSALTFWTAPSGSNAVVERMRITNGGNIGIGTTTPGTLLHLNSSGNPELKLGGTAAGSRTSVILSGTAGDWYLQQQANVYGGALMLGTSAGVGAMTIERTGDIGIATSTPSYTLDVVGTAQFSQPIIVGTPTLASHATTKSYVDSAFTGGTATGTLASLVVTGTTTLQGTTILTGLSGVLKTSAGVISGSATTDDLTEGAINKYFSNTQARNALSGTSPINYSQTTGVIALNTVPVGSGGTGTTTLTGMLKGNGVNAFSGVTGTANYLTKWSDANTLGTSTLYESGGSIGIGTTSLPFRLSVLGDTTIRFGVHTTDYIGVNGSAFGIRMGTSTGNTYSELLAISAGGSAWNNLILQSGGGSVGIGTTTPSSNFQVSGTVKLNSAGGDFSIDGSGNFVIQL